MQILRLLAARRFRSRRRAVSKITATAPCTPCGGRVYREEEDDGPFFDLDLSCCSAPASSAGSQAAESGSESEDSCCARAAVAGDLDFVISLQRDLFFRGAARQPPPALKFCASEPSDAAAASRRCGSGNGNGAQLRTLSFGSTFRGGRLSFSRSSSSARSARLFAAYGAFGSSPDHDEARARARVRPPSVDAFTRYLSKISSRLRLRRAVAVAPGVTGDDRLRKSRSTASAAQMSAAARSPPPCRDDTLLEKQDGIASAIAHCKESLHRASISEPDTSLLRSRSDPGP